jgi:Ribbon-helix-helix protein, copG family
MSARESRDAIVSVRISEEEQARLREAAAANRTSVSEFVRSVVLREVGQTPAAPTTVTSSGHNPRSTHGIAWSTDGSAPPPNTGRGIIWSAPEGATISGNTITLSHQNP